MKKVVSGIKALIIILCCLHIVYLTYALMTDGLGVNPIETLTHITGEWGLRLLLLTLAITPLRRLFHWNVLIRFRRLLGVCSFVYISAHFLTYVVFDYFFDWLAIVEDIVEHAYIAVGFLAFMLMVPLAVTSMDSLQRKMGRYWGKLHQLTYLIAVLAIVHYWWLVKADIRLPLTYGLILLSLLMVRVYFYRHKKASKKANIG